MNGASILVLALVATGGGGLGACSIGCGSGPSYADPPTGSYRSAKMSVRFDGREETANVARVTPDFFPGAKVSAKLGRLLTKDDHRPGPTPVAVLSEDYWKQRFDAAPELIGRQIEID